MASSGPENVAGAQANPRHKKIQTPRELTLSGRVLIALLDSTFTRASPFSAVGDWRRGFL